MEDIKIIELFFNRDETAIQELSNKYSGYCYKIVWNLLNNHEDVEECLNDTWLAAWEYITTQEAVCIICICWKNCTRICN